MKLYIIGNGFDLMHHMKTRYSDFKKWLIMNGRFDIIEEFQSVFNSKQDNDYLLWMDFEKALGKYDIDVAQSWSFQNLYVVECFNSETKILSTDGFINVQLDDIVNDIFSQWVSLIPLALQRNVDLDSNALYFSFNYTDTLERLYSLSEQNILHIHGRASKGEHLVVGHNNYCDIKNHWNDNVCIKEKNEHNEGIIYMNNLCKPIQEIIANNKDFFTRLNHVDEVEVIGHSCSEIDIPYFKRIKESVQDNAIWKFNPYSEEDKIRINRLVRYCNISCWIWNINN